MGHLGGAAKCEISKELLSFLHGKRDAAAVESKIILSFIGNARKRSDIDGLIYGLTGPLKHTQRHPISENNECSA